MKNKKNIIIIVALCLVVGAIFLFRFIKAEENYYEVNSSEITSINVYDSCNQVNVIPSNDDKIHVTYYNRSSNKYTISVENSVLIISNRSGNSGDGVNAGISFSNTSLTIEVPVSFIGEFTSKTFDKCNIDDSLNFSNVNAESLSDILGS